MSVVKRFKNERPYQSPLPKSPSLSQHPVPVVMVGLSVLLGTRTAHHQTSGRTHDVAYLLVLASVLKLRAIFTICLPSLSLSCYTRNKTPLVISHMESRTLQD